MKRLVLAFTLCLVLGSLWPLSAGAAPRPLDSYCSPTGDYCIGVLGPKSDPVFELRTVLGGQYKLCLRNPPYDRQCGWFKLRHPRHGVYVSRVTLKKSYFFDGAGRFTVSAFYGNDEVQLGRGLHFTRGPIAEPTI